MPTPRQNQLKIGGRLIMPIGVLANEQRLVKVVRDGEHAFHEEDLGAVRFVPLVGEHGWPDEAVPVRAEFKARGVQPGAPAKLLRPSAEPLPQFDDPAFGPLFDRFADARVVLLGEATHGTSEFYRARASITRRLIEQHGFTIVAVEADWPDAAAGGRCVRDLPARKGETPFRRFPSWMWRNTDVAAFAQWMRSHNASQPAERRAAFYGLDIYNMAASI